MDRQEEQKPQTSPEYQPSSQDKLDNGRYEPSPATPTPVPEYSSRAVTPIDNARESPKNLPATAEGINAPAPPNAVPELEDGRDRSHSLNSIASLGSFPAPPTHFPLPPVTSVKQNERALDARDSSNEAETFSTPKSSIDTGREDGLTLLLPKQQQQQQQNQSPPNQPQQPGEDTFLDLNSPASSPSNGGRHNTITEEPSEMHNNERIPSQGTSSTRTSEHVPAARATSPPSQSKHMPTSPRVVSGPRSSQIYKKGDYVNDAEFGVRKSMEAAAAPKLDRSDTGRSNTSLLREKYARSVSTLFIVYFPNSLLCTDCSCISAS